VKRVVLRSLLALLLGLPFIQVERTSYQAVHSIVEYTFQIKQMNYAEVIKKVNTPELAKRYLTEYLSLKEAELNYGKEDYIASFKQIHEKGCDDRDGGALAAATLLHDDGYPPLMLCMFKKWDSLEHHGRHPVFIYRANGKWGTLGINEWDCHFPQYSSLEEIVKNYSMKKVNVINIEEQYLDWIDSDRDMTERIYRPDLA
jgi:hypothetical protein